MGTPKDKERKEKDRDKTAMIERTLVPPGGEPEASEEEIFTLSSNEAPAHGSTFITTEERPAVGEHALSEAQEE
ncbi:hypothetical protein KSC_072860 [Ktedonobacter sp. SOSP1-52]|nr:hypothetical protein KSC_072860 [Ktedonobacter sp. SOSP1-52]